MTETDTRNLRRFGGWAVGWALAAAGSTVSLSQPVAVPAPVGWALVAATLLLGLATVRAYVIFLRRADELLRKVHLEALALGFGGTAVALLAWRLCERLGAPKLDVSDPLLLMALLFAAGQWIGLRRYSEGLEDE